MTTAIARTIVAASTVLLTAGPATAGIYVSSNGVDSATCGKASSPCATLAQAVARAQDGDSVVVGPGKYDGATVDKRLKLWSANGTGGAVITSTMALSANGITFGKAGKGFSLKPGTGAQAIFVTGNDVTVRGNLIGTCGEAIGSLGNDTIVRDNSISGCVIGIHISGGGAQIRGNRTASVSSVGVLLESIVSSGADVRENRVFGPTGNGVSIGGSGGHLVRRNFVQGTTSGFVRSGIPSGIMTLEENVVVGAQGVAYDIGFGGSWLLTRNAALNGNSSGFRLTAGATFTFTGNVAIGNAVNGIFISGADEIVLKDNTVIDNATGIFMGNSSGPNITISGGNLYGNSTNCGLDNEGGLAASADKVYWGAASGPGSDPADGVCGNTGVIAVTNPAAKAAKIKLPPLQ